MSIFIKCINIYKKYNFEVRTGLNPYHFKFKEPIGLPFTAFRKENDLSIISTGGGISPVEVYLFDNLSDVYNPKNIFIIGNAFGWSTIVLALTFPEAKILAIDAGVEGNDNMLGIELTNHIAKQENLSCFVEYGFSPQNTKEFVLKHFGNEKLDLVFIDGLHTNEQLLKDFYGTLDFCHENTIFLYHDVINWKMEKAFNEIKNYLKNYDSMILYRTTSGMGVSIPKTIEITIKNTFLCFTENDEYINILKKSLTKKLKIASIVAPFLPKIVKETIKRIIKRGKAIRRAQ